MSLITVSKIQKETSSTNIDVPSTGQFIDLASAAQGDVLYHNGSSYVRLGAGTSGQYLQTAGAGANPAWATVAGGLTQASQWRLHTTFTNDQDPIAANLEENDTDGYSRLGSAMVESSGVYTFPATGYWWVQGNFFLIQPSNGAGGNACNLSTTIDNGTTWKVASEFTMGDYYGDKFEGTTSYLFDVTDTAQCKVRFGVNVTLTDTATQGSSTQSLTYFTFMRLADT